MALLTLGLNHNTAPVALREKLAFPTKEAIGTALSDLRGHLKSLAPEAAILSTCNRTEIYCKTDAPDEAGQALTEWIGRHKGVDGEGNLAEHLYLLPNQGAVRHAFRVASGLDSMVLGEPQILGQMKTAARVAQDSNMLGSHLHQLFQRSFSVAKEVRTQTAIGAQSVSMSAASVRLGEQIFENLADCSVLLIGAGEMIELCAAHWAPHPRRMVIANRTLERARPLAERFGATTMALSDLPQQLENFDVVISCTASSLPIIGLGMVERSVRQRRHRPVLMIDLAVPRDIEDEVSRLDDVFLYTVDDLREVVDAGLEGRRLAVAEAESIIDTQVNAFMNWMVQRQSVPLIQELHARGDAVRQQEVERARKMLAKGEDPAVVLEALSRALTAKFMHGPTTLLSHHAGKDPELANMLSGLLPVPRGGR
ncbi:glutamyl-tRNA reductase [Lautropia mirabilis]|jgi:glutamyl-tRNA reductase|uniref:Glutamyl-tRNA reductase n=1 Tax=Lautropia mirabilis ATCC 51599 TaxID=887898 RepID=E7S112_9BURK|nr:glutamyl-tRNA reductase [Lautropia mirabilis]EFV93668.1 glutamyl-tRNA reductase [Lautropia mirabilis ATCC 51599]MBF1246727.1 glutamyl-tRNA reductase [Lautropia mirabilis]VEG99127.1 Glutamyl-tRNA reductase [Lautropia mirabilis]